MSKNDKPTDADEMAQEKVNDPEVEQIHHALHVLGSAMNAHPSLDLLNELAIKHHSGGASAEEQELLKYLVGHLDKAFVKPDDQEEGKVEGGKLTTTLPADFIDLLKTHFDEKPESKGVLQLLQHEDLGGLLAKHKDELQGDATLADLIRHVAGKLNNDTPEDVAKGDDETPLAVEKNIVIEGKKVNPKQGQPSIKEALDFTKMRPEDIRKATKLYKIK